MLFLKKLYALGIRGNRFNWIKSYFTNRSKFVSYNNVKSETKFVTQSVPQRSILGPLFFIVFMSDVSRASHLLFSILFADDTSVFIEDQDYDQLIVIFNQDLKKKIYGCKQINSY